MSRWMIERMRLAGPTRRFFLKERRFETRGFRIWGAHAPSRAGFGALAETIFPKAEQVRDGEGAIASTRGACAPQSIRRFGNHASLKKLGADPIYPDEIYLLRP